MTEVKKTPGLGGLPQSNLFHDVPDYTRAVHRRENTQVNEDHLNANRQKFTGQVAIVLSLFSKGVVLSSYSAMTQYHIGHLPRRVLDIKDNFGVDVEDQFQMDASGKATRNKIWFIREFLSQETIVKYKIGHKSPSIVKKEAAKKRTK